MPKSQDLETIEKKSKTKTSSSKSTKVVKKTSTSSKDSIKPAKKPTTKVVKKTTDSKAKKSSNTSKSKIPKKPTQSKSKITKKAAKSTTKSIKKTSKKNIKVLEYYDLPYRYNETIVKLLFQTPKILFVYWDISDNDRLNLINTYGEDFFNTTKPVLFITNEDMNYTFEIEINDYANSWYFHVPDSNCKYKIELQRKFINKIDYSSNDYIYIASSNDINSPNDHILFDKNQSVVYFKNTKTNTISSKNIASLAFIRKIGKIYNIYDLYKEIYKDELEDEYNFLKNPSSSSTFK